MTNRRQTPSSRPISPEDAPETLEEPEETEEPEEEEAEGFSDEETRGWKPSG